VGYYGNKVTDGQLPLPAELLFLDTKYFVDDKVVIDPAMALNLIHTKEDPLRTLWVFRYYDLDDRQFEVYGKALVRLIDFIRDLTAYKRKDGSKPLVNIIAHSMGGLLVREALQRTYPDLGRKADDYINKIVTLGTPHQGISFQFLKNWIGINAENEIEHFNPAFQIDATQRESFTRLGEHFPLNRILTVIGTNYRTYKVGASSLANRLFSVSGEFGPTYNRSDGLVKQQYAQIPGTPRTFIHKCHGGFDSLVTARESFEVATRFFFGNVRARLRLVKAKVLRGQDFFGKSEFYFGVSIKPRRVDFELFHQSAEAENCYGPFHKDDLGDDNDKVAFPWAGPDRLIWEGYLDTSSILEDKSVTVKDMVMRLDFYLGERDIYGVGFSDNVIFRKQYYVRALLDAPPAIYIHTDERFAQPGFQASSSDEMTKVHDGWEFKVGGTGFEAMLKVEFDEIPMEGLLV
jgi:PGAP1-like protein